MLVLIALGSTLAFFVRASDESGTVGTSNGSRGIETSQKPRIVGADKVPRQDIPRTIVSAVDSFIAAGRITQESPDNLTLHNPTLDLRLLGGANPHDEILTPDRRLATSRLFWIVEARTSNAWVPLSVRSNNFTVLGTNATGSYLVRTLEVGAASHSGQLVVVYKARSSGTLKWDLEFTAHSSGTYRIVTGWQNVTDRYELSEASRQLRIIYGSKGYMFSWSDIPSSYNVTATTATGRFSLAVELGILKDGSSVRVDPSLVSDCSPGSCDPRATAYTFQRRVFYEPKGHHYWVFFWSVTMYYSTSADGLSWSQPVSCCSNISSPPGFYQSDESVVIVNGETKEGNYGSASALIINLYYWIGTISGSSIAWNNFQNTDKMLCGNVGGCYMKLGIRHVSVIPIKDYGGFLFAYNFVYAYRTQGSLCDDLTTKLDSGSILRLVTMDGTLVAQPVNNTATQACFRYDLNDEVRSILLPAKPAGNGNIRVIFEYPRHTLAPDGTITSTSLEVGASFLDQNPNTVDLVGNNVSPAGAGSDCLLGCVSPAFSAVVDASYRTHVVYNTTQGRVNYSYCADTRCPVWASTTDIFSGAAAYPTLTMDLSNGDVYAFAVKGSSIVMMTKKPDESWFDRQPFIPVTRPTRSLAHLGSNLYSVGGTDSSRISLVWTESGVSVMYAAIPVASAWSPFAYPRDPWNGYGLAPFGQYFANLGAYVSTNTGTLSVRQTDLEVLGRGLDLAITRVYTEPLSLMNGQAYGFENYPWAPIGNGWQFDFPWLSSVSKPQYIHLWNGQGYRIPVSFWNGPSGSLENHQGEHFLLVRTSTDIVLSTKSGIAYRFDPSDHRLTSTTDTIANNKISFTYDLAAHISSITDTVGRVFLFCYNGSLLTRIDQASGSCQNEIGFSRRVAYWYDGPSLTSVTDPAGRLTNYEYKAVSDAMAKPWLISRITYPTHGYNNFTYSPDLLGTEAYTYRVVQQIVKSPDGTLGRSLTYYYTRGPGDQVISSSVWIYDGNGFAGTMQYTFSASVLGWNMTRDIFNVLRGVQETFDPRGLPEKEVILVSDGGFQVGSFTNYYTYDLWGNPIYSRRTILPNWYHESFNAYYNDELPLGYYSFSDTFSLDSETHPNHSWKASGTGLWSVENGEYSLVGTRGNETRVESPHRDAAFQMKVRWLGGPSFEGYLGFRYQTNGNHYRVYLSSYDNTLRFDKVSSGTVTTLKSISVTVSLNTDYILRVQSSGYHHDVYLNDVFKFEVYDADSTMREGTYIAIGTYAGTTGSNPVHIHFDNITVQPLPNTFSNNFYPTGAPLPSLHGSLAGTAQLQNGTGTLPIETYYAYYSTGIWRGTKTRLDSNGTTQWPKASGTIDAYGNIVSITDFRGNTTYYQYSWNWPGYRSAYLTNETRRDTTNQITTLYSYDDKTGNKLSVKDALGYNSTYQYDILDRLTRVNYPNGLGYVSYTYDDAGNFVDITNENNWKTRQIYDGLSRLTALEKFSGATPYSNMTTTYNWRSLPFARTDPLGNTTRYAYDILGRPVSVTRPDGNVTTVVYNDLAGWVRYADEYGNYKCNYYDRTGRLISVVENATSSCGPGLVTNYYYDEAGNLRCTRTCDEYLVNPGFETGNTSGWTQTGMVAVDSSVYPAHSGTYSAKNGACTSFSLQQNFTSQISGTLIGSLQFYYQQGDSQGLDRVQVLYSDGTSTETALPLASGWTLVKPSFDKTKQVTGIKVLSTGTTCHQILVDDFYVRMAGSTKYSYDNLNRLTSTLYGDATSESFSYDNNGNLQTRLDRNGAQTVYSYDGLNRLKTITYGSGTADAYSYDKNSNLLTLTSQNMTLTYTYDARNRVLSENYDVNGGSGGGGSVAYGTLITLPDRTSVPVQNLKPGMSLLAYNTTTSEYQTTTITRMDMVYTSNMLVINTQDPLPLRVDNATAQKLWVKKNDGTIGWLPVTSLRVGDYLYNAIEQHWTMVTRVGVAPRGTHVMYDIYTTSPHNYIANSYLDPVKERPGIQSGLSITSVMGQSYKITYTYSGEVLNTITYPDGLVVKYTYDDMGRTLTVSKSGTTTQYASFAYNRDDSIRGVGFGNGLTGNYTYDRVGRPASITVKNVNTPLLSLSYGYNKTGTVASITGTVNSADINEQYRYDALHRLTNTTLTSGGTSTTLWYEYDWFGNRQVQRLRQGTSPWTVTSYAYNPANNELTSASTNNIAYAYDKNGNQVTRSVNSNPTSYTWDQSGRLLKIVNSGTAVGTYAYDGTGRRVESVEGTSTSFYAYLGTETLYNTTGTVNTDYVYAAGLRIARISGTTVNYYHTDHLGSTRLVTSPTKSVLFSDNYQPFGQDNGTPSGSETFKFTGKPWAPSSQLFYEFSRWYDPSTGRFISPDPLPGHAPNPQSQNQYSYVLNQPTGLTDPSGAAVYQFCGEGERCGGLPSAYENLYRLEGDPPLTNDLPANTLPLNEMEGNAGRGTDLVDTAKLWQGVEPKVTRTAGGARPVELGKQASGAGIGYLTNLEGVELDEISAEETFGSPVTGSNLRPDLNVRENGQIREFVETKGGYVSGARAESQALNYYNLARTYNARLTYVFLTEPSGPFLDFLGPLDVNIVLLY